MMTCVACYDGNDNEVTTACNPAELNFVLLTALIAYRRMLQKNVKNFKDQRRPVLRQVATSVVNPLYDEFYAVQIWFVAIFL